MTEENVQQSLSDRIKSLTLNGENNWKQRIVKNTITTQQPCASRLASLSEAQEGWRKRVLKDELKPQQQRKVLNKKLPQPPPELAEFNETKKEKSNEIKILKPDDDETFNNFFKTNNNNNNIALEIIDLEREELLKIQNFKKPKPPNKLTKFNNKVNIYDFYIQRRVEIGGYLANQGLTQFEDFNNILLKKREHSSYNNLLLKINGKNCNVVKFEIQSLKHNSTFVLICHGNNYNKGRAYVMLFGVRPLIERSKADEIASRFPQSFKVEYEGNYWRQVLIEFGGQTDFKLPLIIEVEKIIEEKICGYRYVDGEFIKYDQIWNCVLKFEVLLNADRHGMILLFDFDGVEYYLYVGVGVDENESEEAYHQATKKLIKPDCLIFQRVTRYLEPVSFIFKFHDWPPSAIFYKKKQNNHQRECYKLQTININNIITMVQDHSSKFDLILQGFNLKRGLGIEYFNWEDVRRYRIETRSIQKWNMSSSSLDLVDNNLFNSDECYLIKWVYNIVYLTSNLKGGKSNVPLRKGRNRTCFFFWYGQHVNYLEKGKLSTKFVMANTIGGVDIDDSGGCDDVEEESGREQYPIDEGFEPLAFKSLFNGKMVRNCTNSQIPNASKRLYIILGSRSEELEYVEISNPQDYVLRCHGVYLYKFNNDYYKYYGNNSTELHKTAVQNYNFNQELFKDFKTNELSDVILNIWSFDLKSDSICMNEIPIIDEPFPITKLKFYKLIENDVIPKYLLFKTLNNNYFLVCSNNHSNDSFNLYRKRIVQSVAEFKSESIIIFLNVQEDGEIYCHDDLTQFANLFPDWNYVTNGCTNKTIKSEYENILKMEQPGWLMTFANNNNRNYEEERIFNLYFDWSNLSDTLTDEEFTNNIGYNREEFLKFAPWKQSDILKSFSSKLQQLLNY